MQQAYPDRVETDEFWDGDDEPRRPVRYVDGAWGRTANPNTADGELQNIAAFGTGLARLNGPRRTAALVIVWLILVGFALALVAGIVGIVGIW
jgi:hypothetical protein